MVVTVICTPMVSNGHSWAIQVILPISELPIVRPDLIEANLAASQ